MTKSIKRIAAYVAFICLATSVMAQSPIKIGYINTFSGPIGPYGVDMYDGFMLRTTRSKPTSACNWCRN